MASIPALYTSLSPVLLLMLGLDQDAVGIRVRHLLTLYPERLRESLVQYLHLQAKWPDSIEAYMAERSAELTDLGVKVTTNEELRISLGNAMKVVLDELAEQKDLQEHYLAALGSLNYKPISSRLLLMLVLLYAYLPSLEQNDSFKPNDDFNKLLIDAAVHLEALLGMAAKMEEQPA